MAQVCSLQALGLILAGSGMESHTPCMLENSAQSLMWSAPPICRVLGASSCQSTLLDQCQYGTRWHKRTHIAAWNCTDISSLSKLCIGKKGICSSTLRPHIVLSGKVAGSNKLWTSVAQEYPTSLCRDLAACLVDSVKANRYMLNQNACKICFHR